MSAIGVLVAVGGLRRLWSPVRLNDRCQPAGLSGRCLPGPGLFDKRTSLKQYAELFNAFPGVTYPISVLSSTSNQELVSYSWIFPNVVTMVIGGIQTSRPTSRWTVEVGCRPCRVTSRLGIIATCTSWNSRCQSSGCIAYPGAGVGGRFRGGTPMERDPALELGRQVLRGNVESIFGGVS